jgi:SPP1 gp7 family putative phage head morphogenesis protein
VTLLPVVSFPPDFWEREGRELYDASADVIVRAFYAGGMAGVKELPQWMQLQAAWEPFSRAAIAYLRAYRLAQLTDITETTRDLVVSAIDGWIQSGRKLDVLISALEPIFGSMRAQRIAVTEVTRAFAAGNQASWQVTGFVTQKVWRTANDELVCPYCGSLDGKVVGLEETFKTISRNGKLEVLEYLHPPAHPNCRCWIQPVVDDAAARKQLENIMEGA